MNFYESVYGSYFKVTYFRGENFLRLENSNWFEDVPFDEELFNWCKEKGMTIHERW